MAITAAKRAAKRQALPAAYAITLHTSLAANDPRTALVPRLLWEYLRTHAGTEDVDAPIYDQILQHTPQAGDASDGYTLVWHFTLQEWADYGSILYGILCGAFQRVHQQMYVHVYLPPVTPWGPPPGVIEERPGQQYVDIIGKPLEQIVFKDVVPAFVALLSYQTRQGLWTEID